MGRLKDLFARSASRPFRWLPRLEALEDRVVMTTSMPFTADGQPWQILANGSSAIEAENFDYGGPGVAYHSNYALNPGGKYRPNEGMGVEGPNANTGGTYDVGYLNPGNWMNYTVHVAQAGTYVLDLHASSAPANGGKAHVSFGSGGASTMPPTVTSSQITISNTGGWGTYQDFTTTVTLAAGTQIMTDWVDSGAYDLDYISLTPQALASSAEKAYAPEGTNPGVALRGLPPTLPQFGSAQIESENYDLGGQAVGATGVQSAGYYWLDQTTNVATYPYSATPFRPGDYVDLANRGTGLATTNWKGGDWTQYGVFSATNAAPLNPAATQSSYQATSPSLTYQLLVTYANSGTQTSNFTISSTYIDPNTGVATLTPLDTLALAPTGSIWTYETASILITLPGSGLNTLRFTDADAAGTSSGVDIDYFNLINSRTRGNNGAPWDIPASGTTTHIQADNYDAAPDGTSYPAGTAPVVGPTTDTAGAGNEVQNFTANDALTYTIMAELSSKYNMALRVENTGSTPGQLQVTFDGGAAFGALGANNQPVTPIIFTFNVPATAGYQTLTTATNVYAVPNTTNPWVEVPAGTQKMTIKVLSGTVDFHWAELSAITASPAADKPDPSELGTYAAEPPNTVLNTLPGLFTIVYDTNYKWINPPANAGVPTNDWWTNLLVSQFGGDMYAYPQKINDSAAGVAVSGFSAVGTSSDGGGIQATGQESLVVGGVGATFQQDALLDYGDWTLHYRMEAGPSSSIDVTAGRGLPYTWFEFNGITPKLTMHSGGDASQNTYTAYDANGTALGTTFTTDHFRLDTGGEQFGVFAPTGTTFTLSGNSYTVTFAAGAAHYLVVAVLPDATNATLSLFYQYAYAVPRQVGATQSSTYTWNPYNAASSKITTLWNLNTVAIDPNAPAASMAAQGNLATIQGWLPIDYDDGASGLTLLNGASGQPLQYSSLNGNIKIGTGTSFAVSQQTDGINFELALPQTINAPAFTYNPSNPAASTVSTDYNPQQMRLFLQDYIQQHIDTAASAAAGQTLLVYGDDTYWGAKPLQEYAEYALMAQQMGDTADFNIFLNSLRRAMTDWFTYNPSTDTTAHFFTFYPGTDGLIGFTTSYGSAQFTDNQLQYGYFTAAAGVLAMLDPTWGVQYGAMAKMVAMEYANWQHAGDTPDVNDPDAMTLPFLRTFEPWVGHSYAGGTGSGSGNNQESSSEAMQGWLGLVLLGQALNEPAMTSAGIMGYTMESKAVEEQWFNNAPGSTNPDGTAFPTTFASTGISLHSNVGINFDSAKVYATYFGTSPEYILGIQSLPIWPSLDYLGRNSAAASAATANMLAERNVYYNQTATNPNYNPASPGTYNTFASFDVAGGFGGTDWLNIVLGFQATYDPQATADEYARIIAQQTATASQGTTGLYYFQDLSYLTYGNRDYGYHLSVPLGGVYTHGNDGTTMSDTRTYMAYNPESTAETVQVLDANNNVIDTFTAQPGFNTVTRSATGGQAPPIITTAANSNPATVTGTSTSLSVLGTDEQQNPANLTYTWTMAAGPAGAHPMFTANGTNAASNTMVTFNVSGTYQFLVTVTDVNGLSTTSTVAVSVVPTLNTMVLTPSSASIFTNATQQFTVSGNDQFGIPVASPTATWAVTSGAGSITTHGLYHATAATGTAVVTATSGSLSASANVTVLTQLPAPTNLSATTTNPYTEVDLSWTAPRGTVTGYNIYRGTAPGGESATPLNNAPITATTFHDMTVAPLTTYFYTVQAVNVGGASPASTEASATTAPDLALNHPATASSLENNGDAASNAVDGNSSTRWSSLFSDPQWIYVDLGATYNIREVKLNWETAAGKDYLIQVSNVPSTNLADWTTIATVTNNTAKGLHDYQRLSGSGRYVRIYGTARTTQYGYSLYDFNVYGSQVPAPPTALSAAVDSAHGIDISWMSPSGNVTGYNIYRGSTAGGETTTPVNAALISGTIFQDSTATLGTNYYYLVEAVNAAGSSGPSNEAATINEPLLVVHNVTQTLTGFQVEFNRAFDSGTIHLYDAAGSALGEASATLQNQSAPYNFVVGSLIVDPINQYGNTSGFTFVQTGGPIAPGNYTLMLHSGSTAFHSLDGRALDGDYDGNTGGNFTTTLTYNTLPAEVVSLPDFAQGPRGSLDDTATINVPAGTSNGIPLTISNPSGVTSISFDLVYNPALLTLSSNLTDVAAQADFTGTDFSDTTTPADAAAGYRHATITLSGDGNQTASNYVFAYLKNAFVPTTAGFASKEVLDIQHVSVNGSSTGAGGAAGVHVLAYFGDVSGSMAKSAQDATLIAQAAVGLGAYGADTPAGFAAFQNVDPAILANVDGNAGIDAQDATEVANWAADLTVSQLPNIIAPANPTPGGPDPRLYLPQITADPGQTVTVALRLDAVQSFNLTSADVAFLFNAGVFQITNVRLSSSLAGFVATPNVDNVHGTLKASIFTGTLGQWFTQGTDMPVLLFDVTVAKNAPAGATALNLAQQVGGVQTALNGGALTLNPGPTNGAYDAGVDGTLTVLRASAGVAAKSSSLAKLTSKSSESTLPPITTATTTPVLTRALDQYWTLEGHKQDAVTDAATVTAADATTDWDSLTWAMQGTKKTLLVS